MQNEKKVAILIVSLKLIVLHSMIISRVYHERERLNHESSVDSFLKVADWETSTREIKPTASLSQDNNSCRSWHT